MSTQPTLFAPKTERSPSLSKFKGSARLPALGQRKKAAGQSQTPKRELNQKALPLALSTTVYSQRQGIMTELSHNSPQNPTFTGPQKDLRRSSMQNMGSLVNHMKLGLQTTKSV